MTPTRDGAPLGIMRRVPAHGVCPPFEDLENPRNKLTGVEVSTRQTPSVKNYTSLAGHHELATAELKKELEKGFLLWEQSRAALEKPIGLLFPSRMVALVKSKHGTRRSH